MFVIAGDIPLTRLIQLYTPGLLALLPQQLLNRLEYQQLKTGPYTDFIFLAVWTKKSGTNFGTKFTLYAQRVFSLKLPQFREIKTPRI